MFYGEYTHNLDAKGRLILPSRFRDVARDNSIEKFFVTRGFEKCLFMFPEQEWRLQEQKFKALSFTKQDARNFSRMFFSGAAEVEPDKQGRFIVPGYLKDFAAVKATTVLIGVSNRIEIWDEARWQEYYNQSAGLFEATAERLMDI